jgi:hypothetical protein
VRDATRAELFRGLAVMAETPGAPHAQISEALGLPGVPSSSEYSDVFLFQLYPYASVYLGPEGMMGGEARDRVAGLWRALGLTPPPEPDHLAALVGLLASLAERAASVQEPAERLLVDRARAALLEEHLNPWVFAYLDRVEELAGPTYRAWASILAEALYAELEHVSAVPDAGVEGAQALLSAHLRAAPTVPDPRTSGTGAFLEGLLAPVRSGVILTRADLAGIATALDLGLRAGERRYALEHLLTQNPEGMLQALATECRRQGERHAARTRLPLLADFFVERARSTAGLLETLADEATAPA